MGALAGRARAAMRVARFALALAGLICMGLNLLAPARATAQEALGAYPVAGLPALDIEVGRAEILRLARPPGTVVVGDERVVALNMVSDRILVLSGLQPGETNVIVLGERGEAMTRFLLRVVRAGRVLTVRRGTAAEVYRCETSCRPADAARIAPVPGAAPGDPVPQDPTGGVESAPATPTVTRPAPAASPSVRAPGPAVMGTARQAGRTAFALRD